MMNSTNTWMLCLNQAHITSTRDNTSLCGYVSNTSNTRTIILLTSYTFIFSPLFDFLGLSGYQSWEVVGIIGALASMRCLRALPATRVLTKWTTSSVLQLRHLSWLFPSNRAQLVTFDPNHVKSEQTKMAGLLKGLLGGQGQQNEPSGAEIIEKLKNRWL